MYAVLSFLVVLSVSKLRSGVHGKCSDWVLCRGGQGFPEPGKPEEALRASLGAGISNERG